MELMHLRTAAFAGITALCGLAIGLAALGTADASAASAEKGDAASEAADASTLEKDEFGVIDSSQWAEIYPLEYNSYLMNVMNIPGDYEAWLEEGGVDTTTPNLDAVDDFTSTKANFLEKYPEIKTLGKGYGYAKYYTEPAGHVYSLWSISNNGRLGDLQESKGLVGCFACKTPQVHYDAEASGDPDYWTRAIKDYAETFTENISCANCHVNDDPTQLQVLRADWIRALGDDAETVPMEGQVCGQCHCDYSMAPSSEGKDVTWETSEPVSPYYGGLDSMTPESALAYYDEYGFADWTYTSTGAKMLAVRHAEFEFNYANGQNPMVALGYNCSDCHMPAQTSDEGVEYTSHTWQSPLENEELLATCNLCHGDLVSEVYALQDDIDGRTHLLGLRAEQFIHNFEDQVAIEKTNDSGESVLTFDMDTAKANGLTEDQVAELQKIQREACYYWNLAAAENSEGAHNPTFFDELIQKGNDLLDQADEILGTSSVIDESVIAGWSAR